MDLIPSEAKKIEVAGATVDFFENIEDGLSIYYFDTSKCGPPAPMVNAMSGIKLIKGTKNKVVMINHKAPAGLFGKLEEDIAYTVEDLDNDLAKMIFTSVSGTNKESDLNQTSCQ